MAEYQVKFEVFEGPLDLLLYLIKKEEVDIYEVNLTRLATGQAVPIRRGAGSSSSISLSGMMVGNRSKGRRT